ncbi:MAG TPA: PTS sugar transporter subunit IIA [Pirellulales bacterium]|jgi:PTS system nitrogen regulatory IIA component|nr:PTS sugar transporter subunit IIA [Pirellulales bacterium]
MADDDFDIERLAAYLHLDRAQVARLADRGKLPGRKVQGVWRFAPAEIHQWLESRIGLSGDEELVQMESILRPPADTANDGVPSIAAMMPLEAMAVPLDARTRGSVIQSLVDIAAQTGLLWDPERMTDAVRAREEMHPTALENGVALLHPRRPMPSILGEAFVAFGRTARGIPFGGKVLTDLFFLIASLDDRGHLRTLARLSRLIGDSDLLAELRSAADARSAHELIESTEARLT